MSATHLALLRGINVGGKNKLPMKELLELFAGAGCKDARAYIQSGNVIFNAPSSLAARIPGTVAKSIAERYGYRTPVVLRTAAQLGDVVRANPFLKSGAAVDKLHVMFLLDEPEADAIAKLDPERSPPDEFIVRGREIYLHLPNGVGTSKLNNAYFDSKLKTVSTGRNWRTVGTLLEMMNA